VREMKKKKYAMFTREMGNYATLGPEVASRTFISVFPDMRLYLRAHRSEIRALWTLTYISVPQHSGVLQRDFNHWIQINNIWTIGPDQEHLYHESDQSVVPIFPIFTTLG
jgi:hypothetical protein